jgi:hypothetical protein
LDNAIGEAHNSLAFCLHGFDWYFDSAGKEFRRAIERNPGYATAHPLVRLAVCWGATTKRSWK